MACTVSFFEALKKSIAMLRAGTYRSFLKHHTATIKLFRDIMADLAVPYVDNTSAGAIPDPPTHW